ncbi:MAG: alpha/beta hydrolase [Acetobacterium sp.]|nr:alpha/beta hydrolase [Bacillota bacterium]MCG2729211.1 alpha/beta hydrolase [Acetobacterium sp.]
MKERKTEKRIIKIIGIVLVVFIIGILTYLGDYYHADQTAHEALNSNDQVNVSEKGNLTIFTPTSGQAATGIIFYPGGKVEDIAYAPLMQVLAKKGLTAVIVKMPFNLAVLNPNGADAVMEALPEINHWIIGGHSLGGAMASDYVAGHEDKVEGLVLMGAYPNQDLALSNHPVLSLYGRNDQVLNRQAFEAAKVKMPLATTLYEISGGNHSGFGNYGQQAGDGIASISSAEQQDIAVGKILEIWKGN